MEWQGPAVMLCCDNMFLYVGDVHVVPGMTWQAMALPVVLCAYNKVTRSLWWCIYSTLLCFPLLARKGRMGEHIGTISQFLSAQSVAAVAEGWLDWSWA
jgi:hypothetical protein